MSASTSFSIEPRGPFTLASAARFIAGWPPAGKSEREQGENDVQLGFLVDDWSGQAGVVLRQDEEGIVRGEIVERSAADPARIRAQAARILSLDHDATGYADVGDRDPVVGEVQRASGWLRPVLFHSPYEAACWAVISARLRQPLAAQVRDRLAAEHGGSLSVEGRQFFTLPAPERLLAVSGAPGPLAREATPPPRDRARSARRTPRSRAAARPRPRAGDRGVTRAARYRALLFPLDPAQGGWSDGRDPTPRAAPASGSRRAL